MKKPLLPLFLGITLALGMFTLGYFLGRSRAARPAVLYLPASMYTLPQEAPPKESLAETEPVTFPVSLNHAGKEEFMAIPGIGEVLALRILAYREEIGGFTSVEDLLNVEGIGQSRLDNLRQFITVGG